MSLKAIAKSVSSQLHLSFNIRNIDDVFPGFTLGSFSVLHGSPTVLPLSMLLCVRAQLPYQLGGLETNVVFIDGGNTFRLYDVSYMAQLHELNPRDVLNRIFISRAFTAYQMTSLVLDELQIAVDKFDSKLVILSDITGLHLDKDVPAREARDVFNQLTSHLSNFAKEKNVVVVSTCLPHYQSKQNVLFKAMVCGRANAVVSVESSRHGQKFVLEKHPFWGIRKTCFPSEDFTLTRFMEA